VHAADPIVVLAAGSIAEEGSHDEIVMAGGLYTELSAKQLFTSL
jgi:ABC-type transport system involved in Fe-S cluster assembly fused permease/ATPase subunit